MPRSVTPQGSSACLTFNLGPCPLQAWSLPGLKALGGLASTSGLVDRLVRTAAAMTSSILALPDSFLKDRGGETT